MDSHKNFSYTDVTVAPSPAASGTSLTVTDSTVFPSVPFNATVWPVSAQPLNSNAEIVRVTNIAGNVLTITRTQEGSSARTIIVGDQIAATITVKTLTDVEDAISVVSGLVSAEISARVAGDAALSQQVSVLSQGLSVETAARVAKDDTLSQAISVVSQAVSVVSVAAALALSVANAASNAASVVSQAVSVETAARIAGDSALSTLISALSAKLSTEISAISQAHSALSQAHSATSARLASVMSLLDAGTTGQVLKKLSNADFDFAWGTDSTGGSSSATVTSANISALSNSISVISQQVSVLSQAHSALSQAVSVLSADHLSLKDRVSANSSLISTVASALSARIDTVSNAVSVLSATLSTQISAISQAHSALSQAVSVLSADHLSLKDRVSANSSLISTVASALSARIDTVSNAVSVLSATLSTQISAISQAHSALSADVVSVKDRVSANSALISTVASALSARIDTVSNSLSVLNVGRVLSLQNGGASALSAGMPVWAIASARVDKFTSIDAGQHPIGLVKSAAIAVSAVGEIIVDGTLTLTSAQWGDVTSSITGLVPNQNYYAKAGGRLADSTDVFDTYWLMGVALNANTLLLNPIPHADYQEFILSVAQAGDLSLANRISSVSALVSTTASALSARIDTVSNAVSVLSAKLSTEISAISQAHSALSQAHSVLSADVVSIKDRVSAVSALVSTVASALSARIDTVSNTLSALTSAHNALSNVVSGLGGSNLDALSNAVSVLSQQVSVLSQQVSVLSQAVSVLSVAVANSGGNYLSLQNQDSVTVSAGAPVYVFTSAYTFKRSDADAGGAAQRVVGLVADGSVAVSAFGRVQRSGVLVLTTGQWDSVTGGSGGLTAGSKYYLDTAVGKLTLTQPTGTAVTPVAVGVALSTTDMLVGNDALDWLSDSISVGTATANFLSNALSDAISVGTATANALSNAISAVSAQVSLEISARVAGDSALSTLISALSAKLSTEVSALSNALSVLSAKLSTEISAISQSHSALSAAHDALSNAVSVISAGLGGVQMRVVQTANTLTGSAVSNISGLSISVAAGGTYQIEGQILFNASALTAIGFGLSYPQMAAMHGKWEADTGSVANPNWIFGVSTFSANPAGNRAIAYWMESAAQAQTGVIVLSATIPGASAGRTYWAKMEALMNVSAAGTVAVVAKELANGAIVVLKGSYIRAYKIL